MLAAPVPPVVAVVVTWDAGEWLEESLSALAAQDYPNLSVLVVDAGSARDPTPRVAAVLPRAFMRRLPSNAGFGAAANEVLQVVEGASHFLFCHDDVAPEVDVVRLLVEEAFRSNAGVVGPKLVDWHEPQRLLSVGLGADKTGALVPLVDRGELDQEQHDSVRDVFVAPTACVLVRADLFQSLGGFDPAISAWGEDLDLSWRAQLAGARVLVTPAARVRHLEASGKGDREPSASDDGVSRAALQLRHSLLSMFKAYGFWHLLRVAPQAAAVSTARALIALVSGRPAGAKEVWSAWKWNLSRRKDLRTSRRAVQSTRALPDGEVRRLQTRGIAGVTAFARGHHLMGDEQARFVESAARGLSAVIRPRAGPIAVAATALLLVAGSRGLVFGRLAALGEQLDFPDAPATFLRLATAGWRTSGMGGEAAPPLAFGLLGILGTLFFGAMGVLRKVVVLGFLPLGMWGAYRCARPLESDRASAATVVMYAANPVAYNALAVGRWSGVVAYGVAPWVVGALIAGHRRNALVGPPARTESLVAPPARTSTWVAALRWGLVLAATGAIAPALLPSAGACALGAMVATRLAGASFDRRSLVVPAGAVVAFALLLPWSLELIASPAAIGPIEFDKLLRFETGPLGGAPVGWGLVVAASLALAVGRASRLAIAGSAWGIAVASWLLAWVGSRGWLPFAPFAPEVPLSFSAAALALAAGSGVASFEVDLRGYHFGWRQAASTAAGVAAVVALLPVIAGAAGGRWNQPATDLDRLLSWMPDESARGAFRVLWIADPSALSGHGFRISSRLAYLTSRNGPPDATVLWPGKPVGATRGLARAISLARRGRTTRIGRVLAPMGVRYVVVARAPAPASETRVRAHPPADLIVSLDRQVDLGRVESDDAVTIYENDAWIPARASLPGSAAASGGTLTDAARTELVGASPALLTDHGPLRFTGDLAGGTRLLFAESPSRQWSLEVAGLRAARDVSFGVANLYDVPTDGRAVLSYKPTLAGYALTGIQIAIWGAVALVVLRRRVRIESGRARSTALSGQDRE